MLANTSYANGLLQPGQTWTDLKDLLGPEAIASIYEGGIIKANEFSRL